MTLPYLPWCSLFLTDAGATSLLNYNDYMYLTKSPLTQNSQDTIKKGDVVLTLSTNTLSVSVNGVNTYINYPDLYDFSSPYTMFLGVNRFPQTDNVWGAGLCAVSVTWTCKYTLFFSIYKFTSQKYKM